MPPNYVLPPGELRSAHIVPGPWPYCSGCPRRQQDCSGSLCPDILRNVPFDAILALRAAHWSTSPQEALDQGLLLFANRCVRHLGQKWATAERCVHTLWVDDGPPERSRRHYEPRLALSTTGEVAWCDCPCQYGSSSRVPIYADPRTDERTVLCRHVAAGWTYLMLRTSPDPERLMTLTYWGRDGRYAEENGIYFAPHYLSPADRPARHPQPADKPGKSDAPPPGSDLSGRQCHPGDVVEERVVGVTYAGRQGVIARLSIGEEVVLLRELGNVFDKNAICVQRRDGSEIGFICREAAAVIAGYMDRHGQPVAAEIVKLTGGGTATRGVIVRFTLP